MNISFQLFYRQLLNKPLCNFLAIACIAIGSCSIILVFNLTFDLSEKMNSIFSKYDSIIVVANGRMSEEERIEYAIPMFTREILESIVGAIPEVKLGGLSTIPPASNTIQFNSDLYRMRNISLTDYNFLSQYNLELITGSFFTEQDLIFRKQVAVITRETAISIFGSTENALGKSIYYLLKQEDMNGMKIEKMPFKIIGVIENLSQFEVSVLKLGDLILPVTLFLKRLASEKMIFKTSNISYTNAYNKIINEINLINNQKLEIIGWKASIDNPRLENILMKNTKRMNSITLFFNFLGMIILIVGGFSIFGSMISRAIEQRRSIGLKRALGYTQKRVIFSFLFESLQYSLFGSIIGLILAFLFNKSFLIALLPILELSHISDSSPSSFLFYIKPEALVFGIVTTTAIGTIFSLFPAIISAQTSPIESLRDL